MPEIEIKNYRSFSLSNPVTLDIKEGITFLLGPNNIGKSNLLKLFYELRQVVNHNPIKKNEYTFPNPGPSWNGQFPNQKSENENVFITIKNEDKINRLIIGDHGRLAIKNANESGANNIDKRDFGIIKNIFANSIYIGSFRASNVNSFGTYYDIKVGTDFTNEWDQWANGDIHFQLTFSQFKQVRNEYEYS